MIISITSLTIELIFPIIGKSNPSNTISTHISGTKLRYSAYPFGILSVLRIIMVSIRSSFITPSSTTNVSVSVLSLLTTIILSGLIYSIHQIPASLGSLLSILTTSPTTTSCSPASSSDRITADLSDFGDSSGWYLDQSL